MATTLLSTELGLVVGHHRYTPEEKLPAVGGKYEELGLGLILQLAHYLSHSQKGQATIVRGNGFQQ